MTFLANLDLIPRNLLFVRPQLKFGGEPTGIAVDFPHKAIRFGDEYLALKARVIALIIPVRLESEAGIARGREVIDEHRSSRFRVSLLEIDSYLTVKVEDLAEARSREDCAYSGWQDRPILPLDSVSEDIP
jgi:hypothetical protein